MGGSPYKRGYRGLKAPIATSTKTRKTALKAAFPHTNKKGVWGLSPIRRGYRGQHCPHSDSTYIKGGGRAAARSALCSVGCESRASSLVSVTVEYTSVTVEEFAADINGC